MRENEFLDGISNIEPDIVEQFISMDNKLQNKSGQRKRLWLRFGAIAACFALIVSSVIVVPMLGKDVLGGISGPGTDIGSDSETTDDNSRSDSPIVNIQMPSSAPEYHGSESSIGMSESTEINDAGLSVTAQLIETLPDTYTFFDEWNQYEYRLLRMKTVKILKGQEMTEEFYYMIPVGFMTDFSVFDTFVIKDMAQFAYEYSVMYNVSQSKAEQLDLVVFGYRIYGYHLMGENFAAFDSHGNFDKRLWNANEAWISQTKHAQAAATIEQAEEHIRQEPENGWYDDDVYVHLLKDISGEAEKVLTQIKSFQNGIFVPTFSSSKLYLSPEVQFRAVRYINGFATNESVSVWDKEWTGGEQDTYAFTKARFTEEDLNDLPDLPCAFTAVVNSLGNGSVVPPHFNSAVELKNTTAGVFGWYAKTQSGVMGIIRVTWCFYTENYQFYYDDAYYIIECGSDEYKSIKRDELLEKLGDYEATYIYTGEYDDHGKVRTRY